MPTKKSENNNLPANFWTWFFRGINSKAGIRKFLNWWLILHIVVGVIMSYFLPTTLSEIAVSLLLPVAGIFIGLSFAWGGNAQALLQTSEIEKISHYNKGGFENFVFTFQASILLILITLILWALAGIGIFDMVWPKNPDSIPYFLISGFLFFMSSLTLRECWHVVLGAQQLLLIRHELRKRSN